MDPDEARRRLLAERERVSGLVRELRTELGAGGDDSSELSDYDQHPADTASETFEREKDLGLLEELEAELSELQDALERIDNGTYGIDEVTGEPIDPARLEAVPTARTNVDARTATDGHAPAVRPGARSGRPRGGRVRRRDGRRAPRRGARSVRPGLRRGARQRTGVGQRRRARRRRRDGAPRRRRGCRPPPGQRRVIPFLRVHSRMNARGPSTMQV